MQITLRICAQSPSCPVANTTSTPREGDVELVGSCMKVAEAVSEGLCKAIHSAKAQNCPWPASSCWSGRIGNVQNPEAERRYRIAAIFPLIQ